MINYYQGSKSLKRNQEVDNHGIGCLYATFRIHTLCGIPSLNESNIGDAVTITGNNEAGHGTSGMPLLGRLEHVQGALCTVQIKGIMELKHNSTNLFPIKVGNKLCVNGEGGVWEIYKGRGIVTSVNETKCEVLL